jgi:hypothetical protein
MTDQPGYQGPPRDPDAVIRAALSNPDFVLQIISSYEEQLRGVPPVPWREVDEQLRQREARRHTA